ncbi:peptidoglycan/xylan/chitin deacetylase (PgdA/CDA1 family) [Peribacillus deserti]|uniref:Peptidoglycan/xylan/chitin deacetylase (PgdA/CDA1 family) n=1 Tax=Peribacillus deserti TaxID=673318 RepID=A0ABS2QGX7_9BACI|nr:polysaccharide deacetylase family protein [Peribacillus deserti]MBM7691748.1 peptidoglycan/xylan/chitin deacetylase (PgdA/CDA1 family) [Peribacillus deserti]
MVYQSISKGNTNQQFCAFTFDDGPKKQSLEAWLEVLEQFSAPGTFFFTGEWIDQHPDKARMLIARGHELASHSYNHRRMSQISKEVFFEELKETELAYQEATGRPCPNFFRFPYLNYNEENLSWLSEWRYHSITGDDTKDWSGPPAQKIIENGTNFLDCGSILVLHSNDIAKETPKAVKELIQNAVKKDLNPVKVSELLEGMGISTEYRSWKVSIDVPQLDPIPPLEWTKIQSPEDIQKLAAETLGWGLDKIPSGYGAESQWIQQLSQPIKAQNTLENRELFAGLMKADEFWGYARFGINEEELVLLDFGFREAQADTLVYLLRWASKIAKELGSSRIIARQDMRRIHKMCQHN